MLALIGAGFIQIYTRYFKTASFGVMNQEMASGVSDRIADEAISKSSEDIAQQIMNNIAAESAKGGIEEAESMVAKATAEKAA